MALKLVEVVTDDEFNDIVRCEFDSYDTPVCKLKDLFFPIKGEATAENRDIAIAEATKRQTLWHRSDPSSLWIKVVDEENGKVAGAACWHIYDANPFAEPAEGECDWWPAGEHRDMANTLMGQFMTPRMTWMAKPHVLLEACFTLPEYRRRGVGNQLMQWGIEKADAKGLEVYIDATDVGRMLYRRWGFQEADARQFSLAEFPETATRKEMEGKVLPFEWWPMQRLANGKYEKGKDLLAWEN